MSGLPKSGISYLTHQGGGAGCNEDLPCARYCWSKGLAGGRLARLPQYDGLVDKVKVGFDRHGGHSHDLHSLRWTDKVWEDPDFPAKVAARKKPSVIGVFFMGDLALASAEHVRRCFRAFADNPQHQGVFLTKRPELLLSKLRHPGRPSSGAVRVGTAYYDSPNVWFGISASTQEEYDTRVSVLCDPETGWPGHCWVSLEPQREEINLGRWLGERRAYDCPGKHGHALLPCPFCNDSGTVRDGGIGWAIAGSADTLAHGADLFTPEIARSIRDQCQAAGVPFWLKQAAWCAATFYSPRADKPGLQVDWVVLGRGGGKATKHPALDRQFHEDAPPPIAAILREEVKL